MSRKDMVWVRVKKPIKLLPSEKESLMKRIEAEIAKTTKLLKSVSRIDIKAGRVYLYKLYEPTITEGTIFTLPLIDGKYLEFPYARITMYFPVYKDCSLDWPTSDNKWMTLEEGSLEECIQKAEQSDWFE